METINSRQFSQSTVQLYKTKIDCSIKFYPTVWREELTIVKIDSNSVRIIIDGNCFTANQGDFVIIRPFALHSFSPAESESALSIVSIRLRNLDANNTENHSFGALLSFFHEKNAPYLIKTDNGYYSEIASIITRINDTADSETAEENIFLLFKTIYENRLPARKYDMTVEKRCFAAKKILEYISCNYTYTISVKTLAEECGYSEFYIMKLFKQFTGISCIEYVNGYRIMQACKLLAETNTDANDIARQIGYTNISYFNRQFKRLTGCTPLVMRLTMRK